MANVPLESWDENAPAGADQIALGDNQMRRLKTQIRQVIDVDHDFPSSGNAEDVGQHKKVTLQEQTDLGSGAVGTTILGSQTIDGKGELVYTDEDDNDIQLTKAGKVCLNQVSLASVAGIMNLIYPVGSVVTLGVSTNPATLYGVGTWTAIAGKVIVGIDAGQTEFDTLNKTGGAKTVTLDTTMIPAHTHTVQQGNSEGTGAGLAPNSNTSGSTITSSSTGGGLAHENMPPYICKFVWERVA